MYEKFKAEQRKEAVALQPQKPEVAPTSDVAAAASNADESKPPHVDRFNRVRNDRRASPERYLYNVSDPLCVSGINAVR